MKKSSLLIEMIELLRRSPGLAAAELARELNRSERTIYRWLSELSSDLHIPVCCSDGGYYLLDSRCDKGLDLRPEEIAALRLSLRSSPFTDGSPIRSYAEAAWQKMRSAAGGPELQSSAEFAEHCSVAVTAPRVELQPRIAEMLERAVRERHRLNVIYRSQRSQRVKQYLIDPYALTFRRHSWYILAYSHEHGKVVQFKLARFWRVEDTGIQFDPPRGFSVDDYFRLSWEAWAGGNSAILVKVRFDPTVATMVAESQRHPTQVVHPQQDGGIIFEVTLSATEEIAAWIMGYGSHAEVLEPEELRCHVRDHSLRMAQLYSSA